MNQMTRDGLFIADPTPEALLTAWAEQHLQGRIVSIERQPRWRPSWYAEFQSGGQTKSLYFRSRRLQAELLFFPLAHEAEVLRVLHAHGIPSPTIYGLCPEPEAIVMDRMPGRPNLGTAETPAEGTAVLRDFMGVLARMHAIPPERFLGAGLEIPRDARELALFMFDRFEKIQRANKRRPAPAVTFVMNWARRNVPLHRTTASFITCDAGQFLFDKGRVTSVLDMELAYIGDTAQDIACLLLRDLSEPLGDLSAALGYYETLAGPIDWEVVKYYLITWGIMTPMVTLHLSQDPPPELDLAYNDDQSITLTRIPLEILAELIGVTLDPAPPAYAASGRGGSVAQQAALAALRGALSDVHPRESFEQYRRGCASEMADYLEILIEHERDVLTQDRDEAARLLGRDIADPGERDAALEQFAMNAAPDADAELVKFFHRHITRREALLGPKPKLFPRRTIQRPDKTGDRS
jgi:aminoglycoside phosphotransferase (APT) family kinase protein